MVYIVPNWNLHFSPLCFESVDSMYAYADKNMLCVSLVERSNKYFHKKYGFNKNSIVFVGSKYV